MQNNPHPFHIPLDRRRLLRSMALSTAGFSLSGSLAEALTLTPRVTEGPFYPNNSPFNNIPLDKDNDLVHLNDHLTPASGAITYVSGKVLDRDGSPIRGALVELWHADAGGEYIYSQTAPRNPKADPNFQGFGQFLTGKDGTYQFRTVRAGLYRGRTRHLHFGITTPGQMTRFTTQLFWNEVPKDADGKAWPTTNENDHELSSIPDATQRASVVKDFLPVPGSSLGEVATVWDIIMGVTHVEPAYPQTPEGSLIITGKPVPERSAAKPRFQITVPSYPGYSYEVYANPTMGSLGWAALPFSLTPDGKLDRNIQAATEEGKLDLYVERESVHGSYYVGFRVPGANTGTPGKRGRGPGGRPPGPLPDGERPPPPI